MFRSLELIVDLYSDLKPYTYCYSVAGKSIYFRLTVNTATMAWQAWKGRHYSNQFAVTRRPGPHELDAFQRRTGHKQNRLALDWQLEVGFIRGVVPHKSVTVTVTRRKRGEKQSRTKIMMSRRLNRFVQKLQLLYSAYSQKRLERSDCDCMGFKAGCA
jgi:hypothetical protein